MAQLSIKIPYMDELSVIRYLLDEIEEEKTYNEMYYKQMKQAKREAEEKGGYYVDYMGEFTREPRKSVIKDNKKTIRRLLLKIREV